MPSAFSLYSFLHDLCMTLNHLHRSLTGICLPWLADFVRPAASGRVALLLSRYRHANSLMRLYNLTFSLLWWPKSWSRLLKETCFFDVDLSLVNFYWSVLT